MKRMFDFVTPWRARQASRKVQELLEPYFDADHYLAGRPELASPDETALAHYLRVGWRQGRDPSPDFHNDFYLDQNPDVAASGMNPLLHYVSSGKAEGRAAAPAVPEPAVPDAPPEPAEPDPMAVLRSEVAEHFDAEYYLRESPDVASAGEDPLDHFLRVGWQEGRNPSPAFNTIFYLAQNPDVAASGINPLHHYVVGGRAEGRAGHPSELPEPAGPGDASAPADDGLAEARAVIGDHFEPAFYLDQHPDIAATGMDPLAHYLHYGWKEGRNPSPDFDSAFYLDQYPDVARAGTNPLMHFLFVGRHEGRFPRHPIRPELGHLMVEAWRTASPAGAPRGAPALDAPADFDLDRHLTATFTAEHTRFVVTFSHDAYTSTCGGIQNVVGREQQRVNEAGGYYLHISPLHRMGHLSKDLVADDFPVVIIANGHPLGVGTMGEAGRAVKAALERAPAVEVVAAVHSLLGHSPEIVREFLQGLEGVGEVFFWLHDFSSLCPSYTLMRNSVSFCGAPPPGSRACGVCHAGPARARHLARIAALFEAVALTAVAPSQSCLEFWRSKHLFRFARSVVHPHLTLDSSASGEVPPPSRRGGARAGIRVAFCGYPVHHKGWFVFQSIVDAATRAREPIEFFHFGEDASSDARVTFHRVRVGEQADDAMTTSLAAAGIDVVIVPTLLPETFCFVAHEAIAAGCIVVTLAGSGHVAALADAWPQVVSYPDERALVAAFASGSFRQSVEAIGTAGFSTPVLRHTGTTATLHGSAS